MNDQERNALRPRATLGGVSVGGEQPVRIMAVLNVSPESFFSGSVSGDEAALRAAAGRAVEEGADLIDIGAMSTAPYLQTRIDEEEEIRRMVWALRALREAVELPLSADTTRAAVAAVALAEGAEIVNDVSGLADPRMAEVVAQAEGGILVAAEREGDRTETRPLELVRRRLDSVLQRALQAGTDPSRIVLDPGIGFFTRTAVRAEDFNCTVLRRLGDLLALGRPLLVGVSRKAFIGKLTGRKDPAERLWGSLAATAVAVVNGAAVVRTHDVAATRDAVRVAQALR